MGGLNVYSASAGSGKTHRIVGEYISLLFSDDKAYKHILAVTFTNKAGEEMKSRIIKELNNLGTGGKSDYTEKLKKEYNLTETQIQAIAKKKFKEILHDYSNFSISTIDSFFQKILKNFTYETGIQFNYEIELDIDNVISQVVDSLINKSSEDPNLKKYLISLIDQNIYDGKKWDTRHSLKKFILDIFSSNYREYETEYNSFFNDKNKTKNFLADLNILINNFEKENAKYHQKINDILSKHSLGVESFKGGKTRSIIKRILGFKNKFLKDTIEQTFNKYDDITEWLVKKDQNDEGKKQVAESLLKVCCDYKMFLETELLNYNTATLIRRQFHFIALIGYAFKELDEYKKENNKFLISEVPSFLAEISTQNSSPFIYEKIGNYYNNYLIDEFQDTATTQWKAFYPLIQESLSKQSKNNILVGDVKQSIYGWRGGDWELLSEKVQQQFPHFYKLISLDKNYRSGKNIVEFNNIFFKNAAEILQNTFNENITTQANSTLSDKITKSVYNNIIQEPNSESESYIAINIIENKEKSADNRLLSMDIMIEQIEKVQQNNYNAGDIMILVRSNTEGKDVADYIINYSQSPKAKENTNYDVISADSLFISNNDAVSFLISCLKYFTNPEDKLAFTETAYILYRINYLNSDTEVNFEINKYCKDFETKIQEIQPLLTSLSLPEFTDKLIGIFNLNDKSNVPFLTSFRDLIHEYSQNKSSDIYEFLEWWEEFGIQKTIKIPENQNAINIITAHKSKGLAAEFVFVPFCNWKFGKSDGIVWCELNKSPFNLLPAWSLNYNQSLKFSFAAEAYDNENFDKTLESFNLMYVAFTRAKKGLFVTSVNKQSSNPVIKDVGQLLADVISHGMANGELDLKEIENENSEIKTFVKGSIIQNKSSDDLGEYFDSYPVYFPSRQPIIKQFNKREGDSFANEMIHKGIVYHELFEKIKTIDDLRPALKEIALKGLIRESEQEGIFAELKELLSNQLISDWYGNKYEIINEAEIFCGNGETRRPDRIMIKDNEAIVVDYKFGNIENRSHVKQISEYGELLKEIGFSKVEMYVWYVFSNILIKVSEEGENRIMIK